MLTLDYVYTNALGRVCQLIGIVSRGKLTRRGGQWTPGELANLRRMLFGATLLAGLAHLVAFSLLYQKIGLFRFASKKSPWTCRTYFGRLPPFSAPKREWSTFLLSRYERMSHRKRPLSRMAWSVCLVAGTCLLLAGCRNVWSRGASPWGGRSSEYDMSRYHDRPREEKRSWFASWFVEEEPPAPTNYQEWHDQTEQIRLW